jgi:hypothetical protein
MKHDNIYVKAHLKNTNKKMILHNIKEIEDYIEDLRLSAEEVRHNLAEISGYCDPLEFLWKIKFEQVGYDPLDSKRSLNFIEQLNQTFTYLASFKAAKYLFEKHSGLDSLTLNLGTRSGTDIISTFDGGIAAEIFAAVNPDNNNKLQKDIDKVSSIEAQHKYVFFMCPGIDEGPYDLMENEIIIWSLGNDLF